MEDVIVPTTYRPDGWPECPNCHEDELYSLMPGREWLYAPTLARFYAYPFACYLCRWRGYVEDWPGLVGMAG